MKTVWAPTPQRALLHMVYILPLRNENVFVQNYSFFYDRVYILPLRNENFLRCSDRNTTILVYILPLRNENPDAPLLPPHFWQYRLYPTFKEWKPRRTRQSEKVSWCLYPTFKEWKLVTNSVQKLGFRCTGLYPTFKEWKRSWNQQRVSDLIFQFISYL